MRIAIIGAGAVGGTLAALLDRAGHDVTVTARGAQLDAIRRDGLALDGGWGEHLAHVDARERLADAPELALLTTKAQDARAALADNLPALASSPLVVVQNGLGGIRVARELLETAPLLGGLAMFAASYLSPGRVTVTGPQPMQLGAAEGTSPELLQQVAAVLTGALPIEVVDDLDAAQWSKLLVNHVNALPAITGLSVQETVADPGLLEVLAASLRETIRIAEQRGVRFTTVQGVPGPTLHLLGALPLGLTALFPRMLAHRMGEVPNPGSTLQSIRRGQRTEIDYLNGAVVAAAAELGVTAPINALLTELVHRVEDSGVFLDPETVVAQARALA